MIPSSTEDMRWIPTAMNFEMSLTEVRTCIMHFYSQVGNDTTELNGAVVKVQDVPGILMQNLNHGIDKLLEKAGLSLEDEPLPLLFAIKPGEPKILDMAQKAVCDLSDEQLKHS